MTGLAGSHGPWISFLYFCNPINHQLQTPILSSVSMPPSIAPVKNAPRPFPVRVANKPPHAAVTSAMVRARWPSGDRTRSCRRKIGNKPYISMEKRVNEKTCVVEGNLEARTAEAIIAEFVDIEAGNLWFQYQSRLRRGSCSPYRAPVPPP
jgi:hypothetical protein